MPEALVPAMTRSPLKQKVLFICSGNFYRSRFAEAVFNHEARLTGLGWTAFSRGIRPHLSEGNISPHAESALVARGITTADTPGPPTELTTGDIMEASTIVAMSRAEHESKLGDRFGAWIERTEYWNVADIPEMSPEDALPQIERKILSIIRLLENNGALAAEPYPAFVGEF